MGAQFRIMKKRIHINQHKIKSNAKNDCSDAVITCKTYKENVYADKLRILDKNGNTMAEVIYSPHKPLTCGAKVWIETSADVEIESGSEIFTMIGHYE